MQKLVDDNLPVEIPDIDCGEYLIGYLMEIGPTMNGAMGEVPLTHCEIAAWSGLLGISLNPFEVRTLRRLSFEYLAESQRATKQGCPPPYGPIARREDVAKKIDAIFG